MDRVLAWAGPDSGEAWRDALHWLRAFVLLHTGARTWLSYAEGPVHALWVDLTVPPLIAVCALGMHPTLRLAMSRVAAVIVGAHCLLKLPLTENHLVLEWLVLAFLALLDDREEAEATLLLQALRWNTALFFFFTGFQKLAHGRYFDGQFLGFAVATEGRFAAFFEWWLPPLEFERLRGLEAGDAPPVGAGPYSVDDPLFLLLSNGVWLFELLAAVLLLWPRTRRLAAAAVVVFVVGIELGAREVTFGMLMVALALLFAGGPWNRRAFFAFGAAYLYLALAQAFPAWLPIFRMASA